jgi:CheY-like chemotaxis protein
MQVRSRTPESWAVTMVMGHAPIAPAGPKRQIVGRGQATELRRSDTRSAVMPSDDRSSADVSKTTVLLIEPDILVRMTIADYLRDCGYLVFEGATADDVWAVLEAGARVDVIFSEIQLSGGIDGFGLAQRVHAEHPGIDVVLTSGTAGAAAKAGDLCDEGPLEKPYHPQEVVRRINVLVERRRTAPKA